MGSNETSSKLYVVVVVGAVGIGDNPGIEHVLSRGVVHRVCGQPDAHLWREVDI